MIRQHKKMILLTSIATLLPILIGLLLWKQLPDSVATHWSTGNEPDGYSSKAFAVFGLPVIMLILHLVCVIATNIDPKANILITPQMPKPAPSAITRVCNTSIAELKNSIKLLSAANAACPLKRA